MENNELTEAFKRATNLAYSNLGHYELDERSNRDVLIPFYESDPARIIPGIAQFFAVSHHLKAMAEYDCDGENGLLFSQVPNYVMDPLPGLKLEDRLRVAKKMSPEVLEAAALVTVYSNVPDSDLSALNAVNRLAYFGPARKIVEANYTRIKNAVTSDVVDIFANFDLQKDLGYDFRKHAKSVATSLGYKIPEKSTIVTWQ